MSFLRGRTALTSVIFLTSFLLLSACGENKPAEPAPRARYATLYDESLCKIPKTLGDDAKAFTQSESLPVIASFFGKKYNRPMLEGVLSASAISTGQYVSRLLGGRVFRIPRDDSPNQKVCPMFTDLPEAPEEYRRVWDALLAQTNIPHAHLAGLYFQDCDRRTSCDDHQVTQPTILIDEARDRWTIVHEMMHFNFDRERKRDSTLIGDRQLEDSANASKDAVKKAFSAYQATHEYQALAIMQAQASWLTRVFYYQTLVRSTLEEVTVEGTLLNEYLNHHLLNVSQDSAKSAIWYMGSSLDAARNAFNDPAFHDESAGVNMSLAQLLEFISNEASNKSFNDLQKNTEADLRFIQDALGHTRDQINDLHERYDQEFDSNAPTWSPDIPNGLNLLSAGGSDGRSSGIDAFRPANTGHDPDAELREHLNHMPGTKIFDRWKSR